MGLLIGVTLSFLDGAPVEDRVFDHVVYALGGAAPEAFLRSMGVQLKGGQPLLKSGCETTVEGLFLAGDLLAGRKGGSIISAFNAARRAMGEIRDRYLGCRLAAV